MEYQSVDEVARKEACERVKQIVKAIKAIRIKYYLNFAKISAKDLETYQKLESNLDKISDKHNLNNLKVALMAEVEEKYDRNNLDNPRDNNSKEPNGILQACYGAIDKEVDALSKGKITQARKCQELLKNFIEENMNIIDFALHAEITKYKREKLAELMLTRDQINNKNENCIDKMKNMYTKGNVETRNNAMDTISSASKDKTKDEELVV